MHRTTTPSAPRAKAALTGIIVFLAIMPLAVLGLNVAKASPTQAKPDTAAQEQPTAPKSAQDCGVTYSGWTNIPALPTGRNNAMATSINNNVYVLGGYNSNYTIAGNLYRLDTNAPASGWVSRASIPLRVVGTQALSLDGKIYVPGGYSETDALSNVQIYDPGTDVWIAGAPLPAARGGVASAAFNGKIYIFGGAGADRQPTDTVYEYNPATGIATARSHMPAPVYNAAAVVLNNRIYVVGGSGYSYGHFVYNPATDGWLAIAPSPRTTTDNNGLVALGGELWLLGGSYSGQENANVTNQIYNPQTNSWRYGPAYINQRVWTSAATVAGDRAYVAGGLAADHTASAAAESIGFSGTLCTYDCAITYPDVPPGSPFYPFVRCLSCRSILGGYSNGNFGTGDTIKRGQLAKVVSNAAGYNEDPGAQRFQDVAPGSPFYPYANRLAARGYLGGYPCGGPGEACGPAMLPYFRVNANASRGQIAKIIAQACPLSVLPYTQVPSDSGKQNPQAQPTPPPPYFADVPTGSTFYDGIQTLGRFNIISGYPCGGPNEPCSQGGGKPYFRPAGYATRGQVAKMVSNAFYPACDAP